MAEWNGSDSASSEDNHSLSSDDEPKKNEDKDIVCDFPGCGKIFKKPSLLSQHSVVHTKEKYYQCEDCGRNFGRPYHLKRHRLTVHVEKKEFECSVEGCNYVSNLKYNLKKHMQRTHEVELPFKCTFEGCGNAFKKHKSLFLHEATHQEGKPFKCSYEGCNKSYAKHVALTRHSSIHKKEKAYFCKNDNCDAMFYTWSDLRQHIYECSVHPCPDCGKIFKVAWKLKKHQVIHLENRVMYKCPVEGCEKEYTEQRNVVSHVKTHHQSQSALFKCPDERCGQTFVYKVSLTRHIKNHEKILETYKRIAKNKKKKEKKRRKQKRLHASAASQVSGFIHELGKYVTESDVETANKTSDLEAVNITTTEDESDSDKIPLARTSMKIKDTCMLQSSITRKEPLNVHENAVLSDKEKEIGSGSEVSCQA